MIKLSEVMNILKEELIVERVEDSYIHNCNKETLFKILKSGKIIGSLQNDGATPKMNKAELCISRSDYNPQRTGIVPSSKIYRGEIIKIQLNMPAITDGKLGIKKPYPVSFGNYKRNRDAIFQLEYLEKVLNNNKDTNPTSKVLLSNLMSALDSKSNYQKAKSKGKWITKEEYYKIISMINQLENKENVSKCIENHIKGSWKDNTGEDTGEERLEMDNGKFIPVSSKYITINIPDEMWEDPDIKRYRVLYKDDKNLFRPYKDTSKEAFKRLSNRR